MLLDIFFPKTCSVCGRFGPYICDKCVQKLEFILDPICIYCEKRSFRGLTHSWCRRDYGIDGYMGIFRYNTPLKKIIKNIKYRLARDSWRELFDVMDRQNKIFVDYKLQTPEAYLIPIPLYRDRQLKRGFNQAEVIARYFSSKFSYPILNLLVRSHSTIPQAQLSPSERFTNMRGIFRIKKGVSLPQSPVILVDDVVTTGSTVGEAALTLKKEGVRSVFVFSVAKG